MDKTAIKTFAINSRNKLIEDVEYKMSLVGITENEIQNPISTADGIETYQFGSSTNNIYDADIEKREILVKEVKQKGFKNVVEEVAYTWFNRIIAIRFLEINNYLPTRTRVLSSEISGKIEPDIITEAFDIDLDFSNEDKELIFKLKDENKLDELFRFLFIKQCNKLNEILPGLFEKTDDYLELLLNISFTNEDGVVRQLIDLIPEDDFKNQVEIIGWLYQFYNTELKDETFANLKKRIKINKERIPAATQLFTPDWIVKYMVENSLGRLWLEGHPNVDLENKWKYYVQEAKQDSDVESQLINIKNGSKILRPEDIKVIDPCMGSGHILVYIFDVLMDIYVSEGYTEKDSAKLILQNNLYGLDIDDRAYQLAYFAVMMKARSYNRRILTESIKPQVSSIKESNSISDKLIELISSKNPQIKNQLIKIIDLFKDAKNYGSILNVSIENLNDLESTIYNLFEDKHDLNYLNYQNELENLLNIIQNAKFLSQKYDVVVTNPPYMGNSGMNPDLKEYIKKNYPLSKSDLFAVFIEKCNDICKIKGFIAMITQQSFMFLSTFEKLRVDLLNNYTISNMAHLGAHAFEEIGGEVVQATSFINRKIFIKNYKSTFHRLTEFNSEKQKEEEFFNDKNKFVTCQSNFNNIPEKTIAYWGSEEINNLFLKSSLEDFGFAGIGMRTGDNKRFLRFWHEININTFSDNCDSPDDVNNNKIKWVPYNKGGKYRKWYGNNEYVVNWENNGFEIKENTKKNYPQLGDNLSWKISNEKYYFKPGITWTGVTSGKFSSRYYSEGFIFDSGANGFFAYDTRNIYYILGLLNSQITDYILKMINPTINCGSGTLKKVPIILNESYHDEVTNIVKNCIKISKENWDSYEFSWEFEIHPLLQFNSNFIESSFKQWKNYSMNNFYKLKQFESKLNKLISDIYSINQIFDVTNEDISLFLPEYKNDIKSFVSYAIGCMFGRYSLDNKGLQFAGDEFDLNNYHKFVPDDDNIIPVLDSEYFEDDIVGRFVEFVKTCFGEENLEENLDFIADALAKNKKPSREKIREYLLKNFFNDHKKTYKKCPIYWQFNSGKENGFNCLVYMHRYEPSLVARIRTDYLHKTQKAIEQRITTCDNIINNSSSNTEITKATKDKNKLQKQLKETQEYDEALAHIANQNIRIDLDDGVKVNYAKFQNVEVSKEGKKSKKINLLKKL